VAYVRGKLLHRQFLLVCVCMSSLNGSLHRQLEMFNRAMLSRRYRTLLPYNNVRCDVSSLPRQETGVKGESRTVAGTLLPRKAPGTQVSPCSHSRRCLSIETRYQAKTLAATWSTRSYGDGGEATNQPELTLSRHAAKTCIPLLLNWMLRSHLGGHAAERQELPLSGLAAFPRRALAADSPRCAEKHDECRKLGS
jgi:hypothetical protein